ncbi:putative lipid II flippase FtsW [Brevibacterium sp.]|uniref:putative lipid II flippase FtsW n=1 Tax=Brevibacterium sp. TaxID=1701 RepID=UPI002810AEB7|nr:putative lipid II flippase FtsW [Brevibacterium sp.]
MGRQTQAPRRPASSKSAQKRGLRGTSRQSAKAPGTEETTARGAQGTSADATSAASERTSAQSAKGGTKAVKRERKPAAGKSAGATKAARPAGSTKAATKAARSAGATKVATKPARSAGATKPARSTKPARGESGNRAQPFRDALIGLGRELSRVSAYPLTTYYLVLVSVLALTSLGVVMVLSASSITSYDGGEGSSFAYFNKQLGFAAIGIVLMFVAARVPLRLWKRVAWIALGVGIVMQAAVFLPGIGKSTNGNANWIQLGGFQLQPSEFLKIALAVWLGFVLAGKFGRMKTFGHAMIPVVPGIAIAVGLVIAGNDLGTAIVLMAMATVCLFVGGFPWRHFTLLFAGGVAVVLFYVLSSANRLARIEAMLTGHADQTSAHITGSAWQSNHGLFSLASGGWLGVGLGASREKWSWLPEAHNDFIFAIIGEELGLLGTLVVVLVFAALAYGLIRVIMRSNELFVQIATAGLFAWLIGQAAINIGVVTGLLPVIGLPLPFVSYGGSSIIASLLAIGVILSFARSEKGAQAAIAAHRARVRSSFAVLARRRKTGSTTKEVR